MSDVVQQQRMNINGDNKQTANWDKPSQTIEMGCDTVVVDKMYGPLIFAALRITADYARAAWVIERRGPMGKFEEWVTIPAQRDSDFPNETEDSQSGEM